MDELRVNHGSLEQAAADLLKAVNDIDERMNRLEGELEPLRSDWTGQAQQRYIEAKTTWNQQIEGMRDTLKSTGDTVNTSNDEYRHADQRGAAMFD